MGDLWTGKLDTYLDGELPATEMREIDAHLRTCTSCTADVASRLQFRRATQSAAQHYRPSVEFRERIRQSISKPTRPSFFRMRFLAVAAMAAILVVGFVGLSVRQKQIENRQTVAELVDLHVATLASANPVDVVSTDRHTVKPWFEGKIPFTFSLPELQNSEFSLLGGRVAYIGQAPGAELLYQIRKHRLSVFIFPAKDLANGSGVMEQESFKLESWDQNGLRYFVIGDASPDDIKRLAELLKAAGS